MDRTLPNLDAPSGGTQHLSGTYGTLVDIELKTIAPPTKPAGSDFDTYNVRTDAFSGVNAYFHNDRLFELLEDLGFPTASYLGGTSFPIDVDHRGKGGDVVNAHCIGDGDGIDHVCYALADDTDVVNPIGIALDWRVHLHEVYGHGILYDHVGSANFGFSHSAGDSFAAILSDPVLDRTGPVPHFSLGEHRPPPRPHARGRMGMGGSDRPQSIQWRPRLRRL